MPLTSLEFNLNVGVRAKARTARAGAGFGQPSYPLDLTRSFKLVSAIANAAAGGANSMIGDVFEAAATGGTIDVDLMAFVDIANQAAQSVVRLKVLIVQLLRAVDDPDNGNAATGAEISAGATNGWTGILKTAGHAIKLQPGQINVFATPSAGGWVVDATHKVLTITNTDAGALPARVLVVAAGGST